MSPVGLDGCIHFAVTLPHSNRNSEERLCLVFVQTVQLEPLQFCLYQSCLNGLLSWKKYLEKSRLRGKFIALDIFVDAFPYLSWQTF